MLHRPGAELERLTPRNNDQLLFDALPWVARAQEEHDAFADCCRSRGSRCSCWPTCSPRHSRPAAPRGYRACRPSTRSVSVMRSRRN
nr:arginine deiminase family protein [Rhodococcus rhodochrous]